MSRVILGTMITAGLTTACASMPEAIPLAGDPADIQALAGEWIGEYHAYDPSARSGTILLRLEAGRDTAHGDVLMHVAGRETADVIAFTTNPWANVAPDRILTVSFVRAAAGTVYGEIDLYHDPVCGCEVRTTFTGHIKGNLVEGTFTTAHVNGADRHTGRWRVVRSFSEEGP
ncbi:MAG: hypothetical protein ACOCUW_00465 [Gemmatimonadota bacterium]